MPRTDRAIRHPITVLQQLGVRRRDDESGHGRARGKADRALARQVEQPNSQAAAIFAGGRRRCRKLPVFWPQRWSANPQAPTGSTAMTQPKKLDRHGAPARLRQAHQLIDHAHAVGARSAGRNVRSVAFRPLQRMAAPVETHACSPNA